MKYFLMCIFCLLPNTRVGEELYYKEHQTINDQHHLQDDSGQARNCNKDHKNPFTLTWYPKEINPSRAVTLRLNFTAGVDFGLGPMYTSVATGASTVPFLTDETELQCLLIERIFPNVTCPIKAGDKIDLFYTVPDLNELPPGTYELKVDIKNQDKKDFICVLIRVTIDS